MIAVAILSPLAVQTFLKLKEIDKSWSKERGA